jgi:hypothetical protein
MRRRSGIVVLLVASLVAGCAPASPPPTGQPAAVSPSVAPSPDAATVSPAPAVSPSPIPLPAHAVIAGRTVRRAFDVATDGAVIAWSSGAAYATAPNLWVFDPATGTSARRFHSSTAGAVLANLAVRADRFAFAEVTPATVGTGSWRLILLDPDGKAHVLDRDDPPARQSALLPMAALSRHGILWASSHATKGRVAHCDLRYAAFADRVVQVVRAAACNRTEFWFPRSDGEQFVYGTVEYGKRGTGDDRHVYLVSDDDLVPRRLGADGEASLPDVLGNTVIWKTADRAFNMLSLGRLVRLELDTDEARLVGLRPGGAAALTTPTIGPSFFAAESAEQASVEIWDRAVSRPVVIDRLDPTDPGFITGVRLSGDILAWIYVASVTGGGEREIRWLELGGSPIDRALRPE